MKTLIEGDNLDEITFENRNKSYGAYQMRKNYKKRIIFAMTGTGVFLSVIVSAPLIMSGFSGNRKPDIKNEVLVSLEKINIDEPPPLPPPQLPPPPPPIEALAKQLLAHAVIVDEPDDPNLATNDDLNDATFNAPVSDNYDEPDFVVPPASVDEPEPNSELVLFPEEQPDFPGGYDALSSFISSHIKYPAEAKENGISGKVFIQFVVAKTGAIEQIVVLRSPHPSLEKEAVRVIGLLPAFMPARMGGHPVSTKMTVPINFVIAN